LHTEIVAAAWVIQKPQRNLSPPGLFHSARQVLWSGKKVVSLRLDADVIAWLKKDGKGYQTRANRVLREKMLADKAG
jgi:uncharacterized protein (DUF4415 family)